MRPRAVRRPAPDVKVLRNCIRGQTTTRRRVCPQPLQRRPIRQAEQMDQNKCDHFGPTFGRFFLQPKELAFCRRLLLPPPVTKPPALVILIGWSGRGNRKASRAFRFARNGRKIELNEAPHLCGAQSPRRTMRSTRRSEQERRIGQDSFGGGGELRVARIEEPGQS